MPACALASCTSRLPFVRLRSGSGAEVALEQPHPGRKHHVGRGSSDEPYLGNEDDQTENEEDESGENRAIDRHRDVDEEQPERHDIEASSDGNGNLRDQEQKSGLEEAGRESRHDEQGETAPGQLGVSPQF